MDTDFFTNCLEKLDINLSQKQISHFEKYYDMIIEKNKVMNLTAISEEKDFIIKHFVDSLSVLKFIPDKSSLKIIDIGTGAGFPGIPLKIAKEDLNIALFDSLNKRLVFLNEVIKELDLQNINTVHGRAEDFGKKDEFKEQYDVVISRAVASLPKLIQYCLPFVSKNGVFIAMKGASCYEEIEESHSILEELKAQIIETKQFQLPNSDYKRTIVIINKKSN